MDAGEFLDKWDGDKDLGWPARYAKDYAALKVEEIAGGLATALDVIRKGLGDGRPYEGYFPMRKFLRDCDIYDGDLQEDAVIVAVIDAALAAYHKAVGKL